MASENIIDVTDSTFEELVLKATKPVLVDFWNEWCGPCKTIEPFLKELAIEYEGKVQFAKVDAGNNHEYVSKYGVRSMPTFIMFKDGEQSDFFPGVNPNKIKQMVSKVL